MSTISLRSYNRDIESMIDQGRIDEAIAHARHILRKFPKVIETYRLLGKAYLENDQNNDAADIFQRVLSAVPDDFVAHIGMSLIREEEGNLSSAVQHMERAFEKQPYNNTIQEELKRLYGKRDGIEPPKVRLTQGALARMYLKGDLHQQGISELRSALAENPSRYDLKTLLAEAYAEADQMAEAIDLSSDILKKFPFNLTANRILANTLKTHDHPQEMAICRKRLHALSPYEAYVSEHAPTVDQVPDRAISLERLDWSEDQQSFPTRTREETTPWSKSQAEGVQQEEKTAVSEDLDWLDPGGSSEEDNIAEETFDAQEEDQDAAKSEGQKIPDWMEEAGWSETDNLSEEQEKGFQDLYDEAAEDLPEEGGLAPAEIPDWLMEKAPLTESEGEPEEPETTSLPQEPELEEESGAKPEPELEIQSEPEVEPEEEPSDLPIQAGPEPEEIQPSDDDLPAWLKDLKSEEDDQETAIAWLKDMPEGFLASQEISQPEQPEESQPESPRPPSEGEQVSGESDLGWLQAMMEQETGEEPLEKPTSEDFEEDREFQAQEASQKADQEEAEPTLSAEEEGGIPEWLKDLAAESSRPEAEPTPTEWDQSVSEEELAAPPQEDEFEETDLDWSPGFELEELEVEEDQTTQAEEVEPEWEEEAAPAASEPDDIPDWLSELEFDESDEEDFDLPDLDAELEPEVSGEEESQEPRDEEEEVWEPHAWEAEETAGAEPEETEEVSLPDWLAELEGSGEPRAEATAAPEITAEEEAQVPPEFPAAEAPAEEAPAEEAEEAPPEPIESEFDFEVEETRAEHPVEEQEVPDWLRDEEGPAAAEAPDLEDEDDTMAWLESLAAKQGAKEEDFVTTSEERAQAQPPQGQEPEETELLEEQEAGPPSEDYPAPPEVESALDEPETEAEIEPAEEGDLPDWLAELQSSQPEAAEEEAAEAEFLPEGDKLSELEDQGKTVPDFALDQDQDRGDDEELETETAAAKEDIPDWLSALDIEEEEAPEQPPFAEEEAGPAEEAEVLSELRDEPEAEEERDLGWLDTLKEETEPEEPGPDLETEPEEAQLSQEPAEEFSLEAEDRAEEADLPDWLAELEGDEVEEFEIEDLEEDLSAETEEETPEIEIEEPAFSLAPEDDQPLEEDQLSDWMEEQPAETDEKPEPVSEEPADLDHTEQDQAPPPGKISEEELSEPTISGGMLDRLKASETGELEDAAKIPEWIKDLKEEEDPQETAILWLKNFLEKGEGADLQQEIEHYTDSLRPNQDIPDWMEDLQKEEDPQTTAMLWLEKLEQERRVQPETEPSAEDLDDTDWLEELEREQEAEREQVEDDRLDLDDRDWLAELEEGQPGQAAVDAASDTTPAKDQDEEGEETPPWMKATSPLEGDFLTGELESELREEQAEEEEIPDWLAGYEDEEDLPHQQPEEEPAEMPEQTEPPVKISDEQYTWVPEDSESDERAEPEPEPSAEVSEDAEAEIEQPEEPAEPEEKPDLNEMGISDLESILGVSFTTAQGIVSYRKEHGPVTSYQELIEQEIISNQDVLRILEDATRIPEPAAEEVQPSEAEEAAPVFENKFQKRHHYAKKALENGEIEKALEDYEILIDKKKRLEETIEDLSAASLEYPMNVQIIKTLGDAYMRMDRLQEALDAYSKAEDLLR